MECVYAITRCDGQVRRRPTPFTKDPAHCCTCNRKGAGVPEGASDVSVMDKLRELKNNYRG